MKPAVLIRLRPLGPWRSGPGDGAQDRTDVLYRSDRLYSAVTLAMRQLDQLEPWLEATARAANPAVIFSSLFPYQGETLFAPPPSTIWPPPASQVTSPTPVFLSKMRWNAVRFVPLAMVESILMGQRVLADQWLPDPESACLLRRDRPSSSPFRIVVRSAAAVDRVSRSVGKVDSFACVEFEPGSGVWCLAQFNDSTAESTWNPRIQAAFRLLADSGFGGRRSSGWGQTEAPIFQQGSWPNLAMPKLARLANYRNGSGGSNGEASSYWMLSLYSPASADSIDWSSGDYRLTIRGGRVESQSGSGAKKKLIRMVAEGSVIAAAQEPVGAAVDVAPQDFVHPVYRSGFALTLKLPVMGLPSDAEPVETPSEEAAIEERPCDEPEPENGYGSVSAPSVNSDPEQHEESEGSTDEL